MWILREPSKNISCNIFDEKSEDYLMMTNKNNKKQLFLFCFAFLFKLP